MVADGVIKDDDEPTDDDLRKFDQDRKKQGKKTISNNEWQSGRAGICRRRITFELDAF